MPKFSFNTRTFALLAVCLTLWGCPETPGSNTSTVPDDDTDASSFTGQPTPRPNASPTPRPSPTPTPVPGATPTPTPVPSPTGSAGPTPTPRPRIQSVQLLNRISQMWLLEQTPTASPPVSIPSTYSFRAEVVTFLGAQPSTSSLVVWTSSNPAILSIDRSTGYASTSVNQGLYLVTISAATSNPLASDTSTRSDTVTVTVGNSGTLDVTIE